jgi:hypothetical protein
MSYANKAFACRSVLSGRCILLFLSCLALFLPLLCTAEEFSFDLDEIEKKDLLMGGYLELRAEHMDINQGSVFSTLNLADPDIATMDRLAAAIQLDGSYAHGISSLNWQLKATAQQDTSRWSDMADVYSAYFSVKADPSLSLALGKKSYKWGKGYAWNPVGFINRSKDPNNPEEAMEGYITAETDLIKSYQGPLQTAAFTVAVLPVWEAINEDFGASNNVNLAAKLYLLYLDTDIDLIFLSGNSRSNRFGVDFATNLAPHFEIHGEAAYIPELERIILEEDNSSSMVQEAAFSTLLGIRYLSENDITSIIEYYYNSGGYSEEEMSRFYQMAAAGLAQDPTLGTTLLDKARNMSLQGYARPQPGRQYLYGKCTIKEPFDILYFTPGITAIVNLEDQSYSISPEGVYNGLTNWEFRLRFSLINGGTSTEYGEKINSNKVELRIRHFF